MSIIISTYIFIMIVYFYFYWNKINNLATMWFNVYLIFQAIMYNLNLELLLYTPLSNKIILNLLSIFFSLLIIITWIIQNKPFLKQNKKILQIIIYITTHVLLQFSPIYMIENDNKNKQIQLYIPIIIFTFYLYANPQIFETYFQISFYSVYILVILWLLFSIGSIFVFRHISEKSKYFTIGIILLDIIFYRYMYGFNKRVISSDRRFMIPIYKLL